MKPTIICKRISRRGMPAGGQAGYNRDLTAYMASPENRNGDEKCFGTFSHGFAREDVSAEEAAIELTMDCDIAPSLKSAGVDHWVLSFSEGFSGKGFDLGRLEGAVRGWVADMGYGKFHKYYAALHKDTDNLHCHIALSRVNFLTGKIRRRGFWKKRNQLALTRMARAEGWRLEDGSDKYFCPRNARPEACVIPDPVFRTKHEIYRPRALASSARSGIPVGEAGTGASAGKGPKTAVREAFEAHTGQKGGKTVLAERLALAARELEGRKSMDWLQVHAALAKQGARMEMARHGKRRGLVFTLDGENWQPASRVCPEMSWTALSKRAGTAWLPASREIIAALEGHADGPDARRGGKTEEKIMEDAFTPGQIAALRAIGINEAENALLDAGYREVPAKRGSRRIVNAIDVAIGKFGLPYLDAVPVLAKLFPDVARTEADGRSYKDIVADARREAEKAGLSFREYGRGEFGYHVGQRLARWWRALQLESVDLRLVLSRAVSAAKIEEKEMRKAAVERARADGIVPEGAQYREAFYKARDAGYFEGIPDKYPDVPDDPKPIFQGQTLPSLLQKLPRMLAANAQGRGGNGREGAILCRPHWPEGKIGIQVSGWGKVWDPDAEILDEPLEGDESPDAVDRLRELRDVAERKLEACDAFLKSHPPSAIIKTGIHSQVWWIIDKKYEDDFYRDLEKDLNGEFGAGRASTGEIRVGGFFNHAEVDRRDGKPIVSSVLDSTITPPKAFSGYVDSRHAEWLEREESRAKAARSHETDPAKLPEALQDRREFHDCLRKVDTPRWVVDKGDGARFYFEREYQDMDRSRTDYMVACVLYESGASPDEVYSWLLERAFHANPGDTEGQRDHYARQTATAACPYVKRSHRTKEGLPEDFHNHYACLLGIESPAQVERLKSLERKRDELRSGAARKTPGQAVWEHIHNRKPGRRIWK